MESPSKTPAPISSLPSNSGQRSLGKGLSALISTEPARPIEVAPLPTDRGVQLLLRGFVAAPVAPPPSTQAEASLQRRIQRLRWVLLGCDFLLLLISIVLAVISRRIDVDSVAAQWLLVLATTLWVLGGFLGFIALKIPRADAAS